MPSQKSRGTLQGSCLCGNVRYEVRGRLGSMSHCHCHMCQKAHGAAFGTYAPVAWDGFSVLAGEDLIQRYRSSDHVVRTFCGRCGSNLQYIPDGQTGFGLAVGTLDDDPGAEVEVQIWTQSKAPWWKLSDEPPSFDTFPPNEDGA